jgi:uncharacterized protein
MIIGLSGKRHEVEETQNTGDNFLGSNNKKSSERTITRGKERSTSLQTKVKESYHQQKRTMEPEVQVIKTILESIPNESQITCAKFEGPYIALYTKNPRFSLTELTYYLSSLSKTLKKRFVIRTDISIRKSEDKTREYVVKLLPSDVSVSAVFCDDATGEVILEVSNPETITPNLIVELAQSTGWIARTRLSPHIPSSSINMIHSTLKSSAKERIAFYQEVGKRIFRSPLIISGNNSNGNSDMEKDSIITEASASDSIPNSSLSWKNREEVRLLCLGGVRQVGRSCFLVVTPESKVILDCGINPGDVPTLDAFPRLDWYNFNIYDIDAVIISHAHIDHQGFLPVLFKYGYNGPVYCTEPTLPLMSLLQTDSVKIAKSNGTYLPYELRDIHEVVKHCITIPYGKPTDISPDITITLNNAGHILGSATVHLNISGVHNLLYSGDYKYARTQLLDSALSVYPRVESLITESTYGNNNDIMPEQSVVYDRFTSDINKTLGNGGKVLIPVPGVGRAQEIMLVLDKEMKEGRLIESPIYIEGMISEASAIHMSYAHYLGYDVRKSVSQGINPFQSEYFTSVNGIGKRDDVLNDENPSIIMATSGMLEGGPSIEYFKDIAPDKKNRIMFVSYQINGTLGRRVLDGSISEVSMLDKTGKLKVVQLLCETNRVDGFSGHSDFNQIMNFVSRIRPKRVMVNHGEKSKSENVASAIYSRFRIRSSVPDNKETIRLR